MKLGEVIDPLLKVLEDAHAAEKYLDENDTQFARRAYIRSVFASIEGIIWIFKQTFLKIALEKSAKKFTVAEYSLLSDKTYDLTDKGEPREQQKFLRLPENVKFTIRIFNRIFSSSLDIEVGDKDWADFKAAIEIRNRLAHPKKANDIDVSDKEIQVVKAACGWFNELTHNCIKVMCPQE